MKIQLIDSRPGIVKAIILKEWMRIGLSICLLGLPVILGYFSIQITDARNAEFAKNSSTSALDDEFDFSKQTPALPGVAPESEALASRYLFQKQNEHNKQPSWKKLLSWRSAFTAEDLPAAASPHAGRLFHKSPVFPGAQSLDLFSASTSFHEGLQFIEVGQGDFILATAPGAVPNRLGHQEAQSAYYSGSATVKGQACALFAKYGDLLNKGQIIAIAAVIRYAAESWQGFALHKNGRVIDPAAYIHSTVR